MTDLVAPVAERERLVSLDALRGVAILGILVMNIYMFAMPFVGYMNPLAFGGTEPINVGTWMFTHILFDQKFLTIFAMLFGAGIVLVSERSEARGASPAAIFYRRQFWLVVIGMIHGYLIWLGDILFMYALIGMLAYLFRRRSVKTLLIVAACILPVTLLFNLGNAKYAEMAIAEVDEIVALQEAGEEISDEQQTTLDEWEKQRPFLAPTDADIQAELEAYLASYPEILAYRVPMVATMQVFMVLMFGLWRVGALMLAGMALMKLGVLSGERSNRFYRNMILVGYLVGIPLTAFSASDLYAHEFSTFHQMRLGGLANYVGSVVVALGHIGLVMLLVKTNAISRVMARFAAVGRMALTNYLMHSVILTTVFYGYGLGLYGSVPRAAQMLFVVAVVGFQLWYSPIWLQRYRFGPVEWLWRSVSYWHWQPMRKRPAT
jgi:uncharacterized protein